MGVIWKKWAWLLEESTCPRLTTKVLKHERDNKRRGVVISEVNTYILQQKKEKNNMTIGVGVWLSE